MNIARRNHNLVILPDGKVLAVGGNQVGLNQSNPPPLPVFEAEVFDPATGVWTLQPASDVTQPRWYHSTALLLNDGRVVSAGGSYIRTAQIFLPPNITSGAPRPIIALTPSTMGYNGSSVIWYSLNGAEKAKMACLIRLGSTTHGFDQDQRRVPLKITDWGNEGQFATITLDTPGNANIAPPGYYMLFILSEYATSEFAPCTQAAYVRVGP